MHNTSIYIPLAQELGGPMAILIVKEGWKRQPPRTDSHMQADIGGLYVTVSKGVVDIDSTIISIYQPNSLKFRQYVKNSLPGWEHKNCS